MPFLYNFGVLHMQPDSVLGTSLLKKWSSENNKSIHRTDKVDLYGKNNKGKYVYCAVQLLKKDILPQVLGEEEFSMIQRYIATNNGTKLKGKIRAENN